MSFNDSEYVGQFKEGKNEEKGIYNTSDGGYYEGEYKTILLDKKHGSELFETQDGSTNEEGIFEGTIKG